MHTFDFITKKVNYMLLRLIILTVIVAAALLILAGQWGLLRGRAPNNLGLQDGKLKPPSKTENSVSSQASLYPEHPMHNYAQIAPIAFTGDAAHAFAKLKHTVASLVRTSVVTDTDNYYYVQSTTFLLRFTDDVEFVLDTTNSVIHVRSASRLGRKDFGVNRKRIEAIRTAFNAA
jgi:uncharacterized protein (DUF1499 family)